MTIIAANKSNLQTFCPSIYCYLKSKYMYTSEEKVNTLYMYIFNYAEFEKGFNEKLQKHVHINVYCIYLWSGQVEQ
jgi:hypothetical protein